MRIFICESHFSAGGAERVVANLANFLSKNHTVKVVSLTKSEMAYKIEKTIMTTCIDKKVYRTDVGKVKKVINKITKNSYRLYRLKKEIRDFDPDLILAFLPEPSFLTLFLKKKNIPVVISVRNDPKIEYKSKGYHALMKWLYPRVDGIVFQTEEAKSYFKNIITCSTNVIPNPINPEFIRQPFNGIRTKNIVAVGRLSKQKNHKILIEAFSKLSKKFKDYNLIIYGEGELREELISLIKKKKLTDKVFLPGVQKDIKDKIYDASLFVMPSLYEGMPNALMEAMALGLPVISTDCPCGGPAFLIENGENGLLVKVNDISGLTKAMEKVLSDPKFSRKLSLGATKIAQTLSPDKINKEWESFLLQIKK